MTVYTDTFGGATIYPSEVSFSALTLTADVELAWPQETSSEGPLATRIINVSASAPGHSIYMPEASKTGTGQTILFNNTGAATFTVRDFDGTQLVVPAAGALWQIYLNDNSTAAGDWNALNYGATVSVPNASALAGTGIVAVGSTLSQSVPVTSFNTDYEAGVNDRAKMFLWTGAGGVLDLPSAQDVGNNWFMELRNGGTGAIVATPAGINTINDGATLSFQPGDSARIVSDGTNFSTIGFGQDAVFAFDYTTVNVAGTGDYTLAGSELNRIAYKFTGVLTGDRDIVVPDTVQQYWITNGTTGAFILTVRTSGGTGVTVGQDARTICYCDGSDVVDADTATVSTPIAVNQGGTGATTAGGALINLGGTSTGIALFEAATPAAAYAALNMSGTF